MRSKKKALELEKERSRKVASQALPAGQPLIMVCFNRIVVINCMYCFSLIHLPSLCKDFTVSKGQRVQFKEADSYATTYYHLPHTIVQKDPLTSVSNQLLLLLGFHMLVVVVLLHMYIVESHIIVSTQRTALESAEDRRECDVEHYKVQLPSCVIAGGYNPLGVWLHHQLSRASGIINWYVCLYAAFSMCEAGAGRKGSTEAQICSSQSETRKGNN